MDSTQTLPQTAPLVPGQPLVGNALQLTRNRLAFLQTTAALAPVVRFRMFNLELYHLSDAEGAQHILVDNARNYVKGPLFDPMRSLVGNGLFLSDGDFWLRQRRMMQPAFHHRRLDALVAGMAAETQVSLEGWARSAAAGQPVNMAGETALLAMRVVTRALFSTTLAGAESSLAAATTVIIDEIASRFDMPFYPPLSVPTPRNLRTRAALREIDQAVFAIIEQRRASSETKDDLMAMLMEARDEQDGRGMTDRQLRDEVLIMFAAGHETTATAMAWAMLEIQRNPAIFQRLRAEVDEVLGGRTPTAADLPRLVYTRMVVEEALRLYPPVFVTNRQSVNDDEVCRYRIPAGTVLSVSPYAVQRDPRYWDQPETFDPEHFSAQAAAKRPRFAYFPFGAGPRQCIGKDFALYEAAVVLAMTVQRFDWQLAPGAQVKPQPRITLRPNQVPLLLKERPA